GQQIARRLGGDMRVVVFVPPDKHLTREEAAFRRSIRKLAEKVEAAFEELPLPARRKLPGTLVNYAVRHNVTRIVLGHSKQSRWQEFWRGSIVGGVLRKT
ncbi:histidine kinase, partial [Paenibacillus sepulcri]|nr:histidine kinase [Paenibacillus sepulcri]